jgi:hypothetical protein
LVSHVTKGKTMSGEPLAYSCALGLVACGFLDATGSFPFYVVFVLSAGCFWGLAYGVGLAYRRSKDER